MKAALFTKNKLLALSCIAICFLIIFVSACRKKEDEGMNGAASQPNLPSQLYHYPNGSDTLAQLGRVLFYDKNLSLNNAISCGSCHIQAYAFADNHRFSRGLNNGFTGRNSIAIFSSLIPNSCQPNHNHFWDGRAANYDTAVFMPIMNHLEMDVFNVGLLPAKLSSISYYPSLFNAAYGTPVISVFRIRKALSAFVSNLYSNNSKFDNGNLNVLENQGWNIFFGKGRCYNCHNGNNLNGYTTDYENIGLDVNYADIGRGKITNDPNDYGSFNVPTLRNIALTAPYMHDGRYATLRQVIDHYSDGIQDNRNLSWIFRSVPWDSIIFNPNRGMNTVNNPSQYPLSPISLSESEKHALEAFLNTLTDEGFVTDPKFSNPF